MKYNFILFITAIIVTISLVLSCSSSSLVETDVQHKQPQLNFAKGAIYKPEWTVVDSLSQNGLTKTALKEVKEIYTKATAEENEEQVIKALIIKAKLQSYIEEDAFVNTIKELTLEATKSSYPADPFIHSVIAELYGQYYQRNSWKFYNRTATVNFKNDDILTWDLEKITAVITQHYLLSIEDVESLKRTPTATFSELIFAEDSTNYRPFLYDFLAHRALSYFTNSQSNRIKPVDDFILDSASYLSAYQDFSKLNIRSKHKNSFNFIALQTLQNLTVNHLTDSNPVALIDVELKRLKFVKNNAAFQHEKQLYKKALEHLYADFKDYPTSTEIVYELAKEFQQKGASYKLGESNENRLALKKAAELCLTAIANFPETYGADQCRILLAQLKTKELNVVVEKVNTPNQDFKANLTFKNLDSVSFKLVKIDFDAYVNWNRKMDKQARFENINKGEVLKKWTLNLQNVGDYQSHSGEVKLDGLPKGFYILLTGSALDFSFKNEAVAITPFWVSNLSYLTRKNGKEKLEFFVMDRESGAPLKGVKAQLYVQKYNYSTRNNERTPIGDKRTDENGSFTVDVGLAYRNVSADFSTPDDRLSTRNSHAQYKYQEAPKRTHTKTIFFTDRAIYRPGQTVYFKGIVIDSEHQKENKIKTAFPTVVSFFDVNHQKVSELKLTTNDYGTFSGSFIAPNNGLTGQMHISNGIGSKYFSVEAYKRPKFEVKFNPVKGSYKLNEKVTLSGVAKTYSGAALDDAQVNYRVVRKGSFPYTCFYRWGYWPQSAQVEIKNGTIQTTADGEYLIDFIAQSDFAINKKYSPTYSYTVYADVIDVNGETHSATTHLSVGYKALTIVAGIPNQLNKNGTDTLSLMTSNLNGQPIASKGNVKVWALKMPTKYYRSSPWRKGDRQFISKAAYLKAFPFDEYADENNTYKWEKKTKVVDVSFDTGKRTAFQLTDLTGWEVGAYLFEATTTDKYGSLVKEMKYFTVFSDTEKRAPLNNIGWFTALKKEGEPGETAEFLIGSAAKDVHVLFEVEHENKIIRKEWIQLDKEQQKIIVPIKEIYRGNFHVHFTFVKHGRKFLYSSTVKVPHTNKMLDVKFETFRNKLLPGQQEEWKIKIKGKNGEKVMAEMVASMYDASLDAFKENTWALDLLKYDSGARKWKSNSSFSIANSQLISENWNKRVFAIKKKKYDRLNWFGYSIDRRSRHRGGRAMEMRGSSVRSSVAPMAMNLKRSNENIEEFVIAEDEANEEVSFDEFGETSEPAAIDGIKARKNFAETAFFYPHLVTNKEGEIVIKFTIPEALTKWKFMGLAHTKELKTGMVYEETVTQKELMVSPNAPRFFREGDQLNFSSKIMNLSQKELKGEAKIFFYDALTMQPISKKVLTDAETKPFELLVGKSTGVNWNITIPEGYSVITYKVVAQAGNFTDGEEMAVPVLTNRMLVTESMPLPIRGNQTKDFKFEKLIANKSTTLKHHKLTLEFTSNPAWYAIQALPYLMEYPSECSEQTFSRFYANSIASHIANSNPKIKAVFENWKNSSPEVFRSKLEKNQELKSLLLEETPWVLNAQDEGERKRRVGLLFDLNSMNNELGKSLKKLQELQVSNGGWTWFKGMPESRYITQHIVTGMGHLDRLGVENIRKDDKTWKMIVKAVRYLDAKVRTDYERLKNDNYGLEKDNINYYQIQYLYARSFFLKEIKIAAENQEAYAYYLSQVKAYWLTKSNYMKGMIALTLHRADEVKPSSNIADKIMASLKENSINHDELGMYWKEHVGGYYWHQAPIETQALLIEAFDEVANDNESVEAMKVWLLKQKQTQDWKTTKATSEACYALLLRGTDLISSKQSVELKVGNTLLDPEKMDDVAVEAGTGYFKTSWNKTEIKQEMGNVTVSKKEDGVAWGAMYWQYFEELDNITSAETPLKLSKKLFVHKNSGVGPVISPIVKGTELKVGDKITVRIELRVDRDMEYVQMKDMRASGLEPIQVFSGYRYQGGLGYYESTKDASTNFFFDQLRKGTYVFEYELRVNMSGDFSNGITTIQSVYAPEFVSHSEGVRLNVLE